MFVVVSGPSCVGKTTMSRALVAALAGPCLLVEADAYLPRFNAAATPTTPDRSGRVALALHRAIAAWGSDESTVVVDGSLPFEHTELIAPCLEILGPETRTVSLTCEDDELERRSRGRGATRDLERFLQQARTLPDLVPADLAVDTTHLTPEEVADKVADKVADTVAGWLAG